MRQQGKVVEWNDARGYGFVVTHGTEQRLFLHIGQFVRRNRRPQPGDILVYAVRAGERGKPVAEGVRFASAGNKQAADVRRSRWALTETIVALFGFGLVLLLLAGKLPWLLLVSYPVLGVMTWQVYRRDKRAAAAGRQRTSESTLQLLALLGGWPGAWLAQKHLRHKSRKTSFQRIFWMMTALNIAGLLWLSRVLPNGLNWLSGIL